MMTIEQERNKALVLRMIEEVWHNKNCAYIDEVFASNFKDHAPARAVSAPDGDRSTYRKLVETMQDAMPDMRKEAIQVLAERDMVSYLGFTSGTHLGSYLTFPPTGNVVKIMEITNYRIEDGKIVERWTIFDVMGMMMQFGAIPAPAH